MRTITSVTLFLCVLVVGGLLGYEISQRNQDDSAVVSATGTTVPDQTSPSLDGQRGATGLTGLPAVPGVAGAAPSGPDLTQLANLAAATHKAESTAEFMSRSADASAEFQYLQGVNYLRNAMLEIRAATAVGSANRRARQAEQRERLERAGLYLGAVAVVAEAGREASDAGLRARLKILGTKASVYLNQVDRAASATGDAATREISSLAGAVDRSEVRLTKLIARLAAADSASLAVLLREIDATIAELKIGQPVE